MNGTNAVHHVVVFAVDESCVLHHCEQSLLIGVHTNRLDEILVTVRVVGNDFACALTLALTLSQLACQA